VSGADVQEQPLDDRQVVRPVVGMASTRALALFSVVVVMPVCWLIAFATTYVEGTHFPDYAYSTREQAILWVSALAVLMALAGAGLVWRWPRWAAVAATLVAVDGFVLWLLIGGRLSGMLTIWGLALAPLSATAISGFIASSSLAPTKPSRRPPFWLRPWPWVLSGGVLSFPAGIITYTRVYEIPDPYAGPPELAWLVPLVVVVTMTGALASIDWRIVGGVVAFAAVVVMLARIGRYPDPLRVEALVWWSVCLALVLVGVLLALVQRRRQGADHEDEECGYGRPVGAARAAAPEGRVGRRARLLPALLAGTSAITWALTGLFGVVLDLDSASLDRWSPGEWLMFVLVWLVSPVLMLCGAVMLGVWPSRGIGAAPVLVAALAMLPFLSGFGGALLVAPIVCLALAVTAVVLAWTFRRRGS